MRCSSARYPSSTTGRARSRSAICGPPPGRTAPLGSYGFKSQNYLNERPGDTVDGQAERQSDRVAVTLTKPEDKKVDLEAAIVFPTDHMRRVIEAAREGKSILEFPVYDGSETGEKVYNTLTVIGQTIGPNERAPTDAAAGQQALAGLKRWPVTVSYFEKGTKSTGEQAPVYSIKFELYENGVSRALAARLQRIRHQRRADLARPQGYQALQMTQDRRTTNSELIRRPSSVVLGAS